jgi:hypothetical protein
VAAVAVYVGTDLDVVDTGDWREGGLGAGDGVEELQVGSFVGGDEPAVRRADSAVEGERGQREGDSDRIAGEGAAEDGGVGGVVLACVEEAGELIPGYREGEVEAAVCRVPRRADSA